MKILCLAGVNSSDSENMYRAGVYLIIRDVVKFGRSDKNHAPVLYSTVYASDLLNTDALCSQS